MDLLWGWLRQSHGPLAGRATGKRFFVKRVMLVLAVSVLQATLVLGVAQAGTLDFFDDFDAFDAARWSTPEHNLGRSRLDADNVAVENGKLEIKLPKRTLNGGEIMSNELYGYGSYSADIKLPNAPSSITGFFLYYPPDYASEIDIEIFNDSSREVLFTTYADGAQTHTETMELPFDPTNGFHEYRFDYAPGSVTFYVDGQPMKEWNDGLPSNSMRLYVNAWFPTWLEGKKPRENKFVYVDSIRHVQQ